MYFHDTHTSLPVTIAEEHKSAWIKVEEEVLLYLELRWQAEEEEHLRLKSEEEARIAEEARMEAYEEERARLMDEEET